MTENENIALLNVSESETTINELDPKGLVRDSDTFATSDTNNDDYKVTAQQISDFCAENSIIGERITEALEPYDTAEVAAAKVGGAINAALTNYDTKSEVDTKISAAIGDFATGTTNTAADAQKKVVTIEGYTPKNNDVVGIIFTNGNAYGETTASTPTHPTLQINGGVIYDICDSRGHFAGKGFCDAGDYIEFRLVGNKAIILNSDIRESVQDSSSGYTIKSNNYCEQVGVVHIGENTGASSDVVFPVQFSNSFYTLTTSLEVSSLDLGNRNMLQFYHKSTTGFTVYANSANYFNVNYNASGYVN